MVGKDGDLLDCKKKWKEYFDKTNLSKIEKKKISKEIKSLEVPNLYLTPKEIDLELNELSKVISKILNKILN